MLAIERCSSRAAARSTSFTLGSIRRAQALRSCSPPSRPPEKAANVLHFAVSHCSLGWLIKTESRDSTASADWPPEPSSALNMVASDGPDYHETRAPAISVWMNLATGARSAAAQVRRRRRAEATDCGGDPGTWSLGASVPMLAQRYTPTPAGCSSGAGCLASLSVPSARAGSCRLWSRGHQATRRERRRCSHHQRTYRRRLRRRRCGWRSRSRAIAV